MKTNENYILSASQLAIIEDAILTHPLPAVAERCFILYLRHTGMPVADVMHLVRTSPNNIQNCLQRFRRGGLPALEDMSIPLDDLGPDPDTSGIIADCSYRQAPYYLSSREQLQRLALAAVLQAVQDARAGDHYARAWLLSTGQDWMQICDIEFSPAQIQQGIDHPGKIERPADRKPPQNKPLDWGLVAPPPPRRRTVSAETLAYV